MLLAFNAGTWLLSLISLILLASDYSRAVPCHPSTAILFVLAALFFGFLSVLFFVFLCRPPFPFGIASSLTLALVLIQLPQFIMYGTIAAETSVDSICYSWNIGVTILSGLPWLWAFLLLIYGSQQGLWQQDWDDLSPPAVVHPIQEASRTVALASITSTNTGGV